MNSNKLHIFLFCISTVILTSCRVYEEDTFISLSKPKQRLTGKWQLEKVENKGEDFTQEYTVFYRNQEIEFLYNETYEKYSNDSLTSFGIWSFADETENIILLEPVGEYVEYIYTIKRLQKNNLWLSGYDDYFLDSLVYMYVNID